MISLNRESDIGPIQDFSIIHSITESEGVLYIRAKEKTFENFALDVMNYHLHLEIVNFNCHSYR